MRQSVGRRCRTPSVDRDGRFLRGAKHWGDLEAACRCSRKCLRAGEVGRLHLLNEVTYFFVPSTVYYQASLVRATDAFFPGSAPSADLEACLSCLKENDLGFVHQILSFERVHAEAINFGVVKQKRPWLDGLRTPTQLGLDFLTSEEQRRQVEWWLSRYFDDLAVGCVTLSSREVLEPAPGWSGANSGTRSMTDDSSKRSSEGPSI